MGLVVGLAGWKWGFVGSAIAGAMGVAVILLFLHDTPESKGLPPVEVLSGEAGDETEVERESVGTAQKAAFGNPYIWILALASACMYVSRYAINGWGVIFLQEVKGFPLATATQVISVNAFLGIAGTVFSGWMSDKWFNGSRYSIAVTFGVLCSVSLGLFLYSGSGMFVNILAMVLFGIAIGVLICFVGGLMAVDLVPRRASRRSARDHRDRQLCGCGDPGHHQRRPARQTQNRRRRHHDTRLQRRIGILDRRISSVVPAGRGRLAQGVEKQPAAKLNENGTAYVT